MKPVSGGKDIGDGFDLVRGQMRAGKVGRMLIGEAVGLGIIFYMALARAYEVTWHMWHWYAQRRDARQAIERIDLYADKTPKYYG